MATGRKPLCFVIGPIGPAGSEVRRKADFMLKLIIRPTLEAEGFGFQVKRGDNDDDPGSISRSMILDVINADLVVADLTGFNPNAFYELGLRHAARKPAIHIIGDNVKLPFDTQDQRAIFVDTTDVESIHKAQDELSRAARRATSPDYVVSNPVTHANAILEISRSGDPKDKIVLDLEERVSRMEHRLRRGVGRAMSSGNAGLTKTDELPHYTMNAWRSLRGTLCRIAESNKIDTSDFDSMLNELISKSLLPLELVPTFRELSARFDILDGHADRFSESDSVMFAHDLAAAEASLSD